ncbi:hypothetical protein JI752_013695 [Lysobacter sp. MMG2]|uniref:hypothetical protein n=1 Tax=Lysobacter sp. MMG2 TaxID=2801338 RepID=UPI001C24E46F|nr:hypothetical protein [Lysobacter sp. MMG2]MBU8977201.1 hypothetical protein [Lysobacter sp. MMG2]
MTKLTSLPERALDLASLVGENLRHVGENLRHTVPSVTQHAGQWLETGAKLGALKTGARVAGGFVRRNPVLVAAAVAGAGLLWYAAKRRARRAEEELNGQEAIEGSSRRVEARRGSGRRAPAARHRNATTRESHVEH